MHVPLFRADHVGSLLRPAMGFRLDEEGNAITPDDQRRKLGLVVKTAEAIWGEA